MNPFTRLKQLFSPSAEQELLNAQIDQFLDRIDPRLKLVPDHQVQLAPVVEPLRQHIEQLYPSLAAPIILKVADYAQSPELKSIVSSPESLKELLTTSPALTDWCKAQPEPVDCYCLLVVAYEQYQKLGTAMKNGILMKDVLQDALRFSRYRLTCLASDPELLSDKIRQRALDEYSNQALALLSQSSAKLQQLQNEEKLLKAHLRARQSQKGFANELDGDEQATLSRTELDQQLAQIQQQLKALGGQTGMLEAHLALLVDFLASPKAIVDYDAQQYQLDQSGVLYKLGDPEGETVSWLRLTLNQEQQHAAIPLVISASELQQLGMLR